MFPWATYSTLLSLTLFSCENNSYSTKGLLSGSEELMCEKHLAHKW